MNQKDTKKKRRGVLWTIILILIGANLWAAVSLYQKTEEKKALDAQFDPSTQVQSSASEREIVITLPETIYVTTGMTMEIYNFRVTNLGEEITTFNVLWDCEVGENLKRKFSITGKEGLQGSYELNLEIYDNHRNLVAEKSCELKVVEEDSRKRDSVKEVTTLTEVPAEALAQVNVCVDTQYNGSMEALKPEGVLQMQDIVYAVLCGIDE